MARRGRPRKHKRREPSGRGSRAVAERANREFAAWQRRHVDVKPALACDPEATTESLRIDPLAATPLGRLLLNGEINQAEFDAGEDYARAVYWFRLVSGLSFELPSRLGLRGVDNSEFDAATIRAARQKYAEVRAILNRAGRGVLPEVHKCCVNEREGYALLKVKRGLRALVQSASNKNTLHSGHKRLLTPYWALAST